MTDSVKNISKTPNVGIIRPPRYNTAPKIEHDFSHLQNSKRGIFAHERKESYEDKLSTPMSIIVIGIGIAALTAFGLAKKLFKKTA